MKVKFVFKAEDDAISESSAILSKTSSWLGKLSSSLDDLLNRIDVNSPEYNVDLSDNSPYQQLSEEDKFNLVKIKQIHDNIPIYMYLQEELEIFEEEYKQLVESAIPAFKNQAAENLEKLIAKWTVEWGQGKEYQTPAQKEEEEKLEKAGQKVNQTLESNTKAAIRAKQEAEMAGQELKEVDTIKNKLVKYIQEIFKILGISDKKQKELLAPFEGYKKISELVEATKLIIAFLKQ